ncbi:DsrE family protein [Candidatus Lokiarchaeum ossiferum]|uniref:DsrE family protein n=1 Tax=Candidatus Lokiarchaeum ossiferum TaxID=2951803 RepID=UPI00352F16B4
MDSVLILCNKSPFGSNSAYEAIRLGAGYLGLGEDIDCKVLLYGDAVLTVKNNLMVEKIGMDSMEEGLEMADLSELPIIVTQEDMNRRGMNKEELFEFEEIPIQVISRSEISKIIMEFDSVFHI